MGSLRGKKVIDLGGGPGHFSVELAKKGDLVTWFDISRNYMNLAKSYAEQNDVNVDFCLGYMDNAKGLYDLCFNRVCWYYCLNDKYILRNIMSIINKDGYGYIIYHKFNIFQDNSISIMNKILLYTSYFINNIFNIKLSHIPPSQKKINKIFNQYDLKYISIDRRGNNTIVVFQK